MEIGWCRRCVRRRGYLFEFCREMTFFCSQINDTARTCNRYCGCGRKGFWCNENFNPNTINRKDLSYLRCSMV
ncbi:hypothetical protein PILCRDRAFT_597621 [Piloderma croceum F 1598]|uniref:Uncharacterized protein n=1 Tax=Piloderma croceum (strain F 1598) TaxID=765440 RepID=A0A0C3BLI2_PILCF|nr:hypothetical protein PILCRDRAFT_597621 [Piloderma croceum F 1598]